MAGTLYLVATPIGNLEDITFRAVRILREVDVIACEDTRQTRKLLDHYDIDKPLVSCHEHNEAVRAGKLIETLQQGRDVALVSDAGTPLVSDPGYRVVTGALECGITVVPVPGPSAILAALAASGLPTDAFYFAGFLPARPAQRRNALEKLKNQRATVICYEAPHRILETLADIEHVLGNRPVAVAREITKIHEEFLRGPARNVRRQLQERPALKGEITLLIGKTSEQQPVSPEQVRAAVHARLEEGLERMEAIKMVARAHGLSKRDVYRIMTESK